MFEHQDLQMSGLKLNKYQYAWEVLPICYSETQLQVGEYFNQTTWLNAG